MKKILLTLLTVLIALTATAQQQGVNYKALIKDASGNIITTLIEIQFNVLEASPTGTVIFSRAQTVQPDTNGLIILDIASGPNPPSIGDFTTIDWASNTHYLNVQIKTGATFIDMGTTQFMAVPYAKHATTATTALNGVTSINDLTDGKTDTSASLDFPSLFLGNFAGANDDGTQNGNVGVGYRALRENTTGIFNTAIGIWVLRSNTTGNFNTANGFWALRSNSTGNNNTANGYEALQLNTTGNDNVANGSRALQSNTTGNFNTANGFQALNLNTTGIFNTANGYKALQLNTTGNDNAANGTQALQSNATGNNNTANGSLALNSNTTGSGNVALGYRAGFNEMDSNKLYIANTGTSTPLIYGDFGTDELTINGDLEVTEELSVGTTEDSHKITVQAYADNKALRLIGNGAIGEGARLNFGDGDFAYIDEPTDDDLTIHASTILLDGVTSINGNTIVTGTLVVNGGNVIVNGAVVHSSDRRLKKDIETLPYGLKEILQLQPKAYNWKNREQTNKSLGLIAQDVQLIIKEVVTAKDDEQKTLGISYTELIPILINAIKEQDKVIKSLQLSVSSLQSTVGSQKLEFNNLNKRMQILEALLITKAENKVEVASEK